MSDIWSPEKFHQPKPAPLLQRVIELYHDPFSTILTTTNRAQETIHFIWSLVFGSWSLGKPFLFSCLAFHHEIILKDIQSCSAARRLEVEQVALGLAWCLFFSSHFTHHPVYNNTFRSLYRGVMIAVE